MGLAQQGMMIFGIIFVVLCVPIIIYALYVFLIRNKKYTDTVEIDFYYFEEKFDPLYMTKVKIPVYEYKYKGQMYKTESRYVRFKAIYNMELKENAKIKVNPDDPYEILDNFQNYRRVFRKWTKIDIIILIGTIILTIIFTYVMDMLGWGEFIEYFT